MEANDVDCVAIELYRRWCCEDYALDRIMMAHDAAEYAMMYSAPPGYPMACPCCGGVVESLEDGDWHGLGNCVDVCDCVFTAQADGASDCPLCHGEVSVDVERARKEVEEER